MTWQSKGLMPKPIIYQVALGRKHFSYPGSVEPGKRLSVPGFLSLNAI